MAAYEPAKMYGYWKNKYSPVTAIKDYFPILLETDPAIQRAVGMIEDGQKLLDARMAELEDFEEKNNDD